MEEGIMGSKTNDRLEKHYRDIKEYFNYINKLEDVTLRDVLALEYSAYYTRCDFVFSDDGENAQCLPEGIPTQIIYQNHCSDKSPFLNFTVKKLKDICRCISDKLNDSMDGTILETYKNYNDVIVKFKADYLKATSFALVLSYGYDKKCNYVNYLDFMNATGLFHYELNHIDEIHEEWDGKRNIDKENLYVKQEKRVKYFEVENSLIRYLKDNYNIDYDEDYYEAEGYNYSEIVSGGFDHCEEISDDYNFYRDISEEYPNKYHIYRWCIDEESKKLFMSNIPLTPEMAIIESCVVSSLSKNNLEDAIEKLEVYLKAPIEYVVSLDKYVVEYFEGLRKDNLM